MRGANPPTPQKSSRNVCLSGRERRDEAEQCVARHWSWEKHETATSKQNTQIASISVFKTRPFLKTPKLLRDSPNLSSLLKLVIMFCAH